MPEEIDLSPAEEAALERAWARVGPLLAPGRADAPFALDGPDLSGLGDLLNLSRQEVLDALFDAALDSFDLALPDAAFGSPDQPRLPAGQAGGGEWTSGGGGAGAGDDRVARRAAGDARRARAAARQEAAEARYREKAAEVRAKVDPAHAAVVLDAVTQLLPKYFRRGRFGGADSDSVPEGALLDELDRRGLLDARRVYPAKVHQLLARMVFLGDLVRVEEGTGDVLGSRKNVSYALPRNADVPFYSPDQPALEGPSDFVQQIRPEGTAEFYSPDQPRVPAGSAGGGRWTTGAGTEEARAAASDAVRAFAHGQGPPTAAEAEALAGHLARLTVGQIHALKAEHGLKGSAPNKAALVAKMAQRFAAWRAGRAPKEAVPDWPADYDVFGKRDVFADEPADAGTLEPEPPAALTAARYEAGIAGKGREHGALIGPDGSILAEFVQAGGDTELEVPSEAEAKARGAVLTHNHPAGTALSVGDFFQASRLDLAQIRAVTPDGTVHALSRPAGGWPTWGQISRAEGEAGRAALAATDAKQARGELGSKAEARAYLRSETALALAKALGVDYRVIPPAPPPSAPPPGRRGPAFPATLPDDPALAGRGIVPHALDARSRAVASSAFDAFTSRIRPEFAALLAGLPIVGARMAEPARTIAMRARGDGPPQAVVLDLRNLERIPGRFRGLYADPSPEGAVRHELAHALENVMPPEQAQALGLYGTPFAPSEYGSGSQREKWAEFFTLVTRDGFDVATLPPEAQAVARRILR